MQFDALGTLAAISCEAAADSFRLPDLVRPEHYDLALRLTTGSGERSPDRDDRPTSTLRLPIEHRAY
jgi:hypothetical protein